MKKILISLLFNFTLIVAYFFLFFYVWPVKIIKSIDAFYPAFLIFCIIYFIHSLILFIRIFTTKEKETIIRRVLIFLFMIVLIIVIIILSGSGDNILPDPSEWIANKNRSLAEALNNKSFAFK